MAKTDFKPVMIRQVEFKYPRLAETYRYNTAEKRSEPCPPTASNAALQHRMGDDPRRCTQPARRI
jgi:hypothetical protein